MVDFINTYWWIFLVILVLLYRLFRPKIKGIIGEKTVSAFLLVLPKEKYTVLNDIMIEIDGVTTQIDHIVVSLYGIFVIETKNYDGWILGKENGEYWTQNIYGNKNKFKNPIRQNYGHIQMLKAILTGECKLPLFSIVAFSGGADIKVKWEKTPVVYFADVADYIKKMSTEELVTVDEMNSIVQMIKANNITDSEKRNQHVINIRNKVTDIESKEMQRICPKCGSALVERHGKYGDFIGCSAYPKCRYIGKKQG